MSKKVQAIGFSRWLFRQRENDTPVGDLASDAYNDERWPKRARELERFYSYLWSRRACSGAYEALYQAWVEYSARDRADDDWSLYVYSFDEFMREDQDDERQWRMLGRQTRKAFYFGVRTALNFLKKGGMRRQLERYLNHDLFDCAYADKVKEPHFWVCDFAMPKPPKVWINVRKEILDRDGPICHYCDAKNATHVDHVIPWSKGGTDDRDNLVVACKKCNFEKGTKTKDEFLKQRNTP